MAITFTAAKPTDNTVTATLTSDNGDLLSVNANDFSLRRADTNAVIGGTADVSVRANGRQGATSNYTWTITIRNSTNYRGNVYIQIRSNAFIERVGFARQPPGGSFLNSNTFMFVRVALPAPSVPSLSVSAVDHDTIQVTIGASTGTVTLRQYRYATSTAALATATWQNTATAKFNIDGLSPSTTYYVQARAGNQDGYSAASTTASATTEAAPLVPPSTPSSVSATTIDSTSARLAFSASTGTVTQYQYRYATSIAGLTGATWRDGGTGTTITVSGLAIATTYFFQVRALNGASPSAASAAVSATTDDIRSMAEIAHQNILFLSDYELKIRIRGNPDEATASGDMDYYSHYWDKAKGELVIYGTALALLSDKEWNIRAYWASGPQEELTQDITWDIIQPAPIIQRPVKRITFVKGLEHKYDIIIHNFPSQANIRTLLLGLGQELISAEIEEAEVIAHARQRIIGTVPDDYDFAVSSGTLTLDTENSGGPDRETGIPFDILDTEPDFSFSVTVNPTSFTMFWDTIDRAIDYDYKFYLASEVEPDEWLSVGDKTSIQFDEIQIGKSYDFKMRVGSPWIGMEKKLTKATVAPELTGFIAGFGNPTTVFIQWSPVSGATHYEWRRNNGSWNEVAVSGARDDGVPPATTLNYDVRVSQPFESEIESYELIPKPVTDLAFSSITTTSARVTVPRAALPTVSAVTATEIEYRVNGGEWTKTRTDFTVRGTAGQTLNVDVRVSFPWISTIYSESVRLRSTAPVVNVAPSGTVTLTVTPGNRKNDLSWNHPSVRGTPAATYSVYRRTGTTGDYSRITSGITGTTYSDTGLANGTTYYYYIRAENTEGSVDSTAKSGRPDAAIVNVAPSGTVTLTVAPGDKKNDLSWNHPSTRGVPRATARVFRRTGTSGSYSSIASGLTGTTYEDTGRVNGTTYYYYIRYENTEGSVDSTAKSGRPAAAVVNRAPSGTITLSAVEGDGKIDFSWNHPSDRGVPTANYRLEIFLSSVNSWANLGSELSDNSFTLTGPNASNGITRKFRIRAFNSEGTIFSNEVTATPQAPQADVAPSGTIIFGVRGGDKKNDLSWVHPSNRGVPTATAWVFRRTGTSGNYTSIASGLTGTTYEDTGRVNGTTYYYYVRYENSEGHIDSSVRSVTSARPVSGSISVSVSRTTLTNPYRVNLVVSWNHPSDRGDPACTYTVQHAEKGFTDSTPPRESEWSEIASGLTGTSYTDESVTLSRSHWYRVLAVNPGNSFGAMSSREVVGN